MSGCTIIDTIGRFQQVWQEHTGEGISGQIHAWETEYMAAYPELLSKLTGHIDKTIKEGGGRAYWQSWRDAAAERIFPFLPERLEVITEARDNLFEECPQAWERAQQVLPLECELVCVLYVGIGYGPGWTTHCDGKRAILFDVSQIAGCRWSDAESIGGLVAHETGHVMHFELREGNGARSGSGPLWELYIEGFAEYLGHVAAGRETWRMAKGVDDDDWLEWCHANRGRLAREFLRRADVGETVADFFGHWYDIQGRRLCGYGLGAEVIKEMAATAPLAQLALLEDFEGPFRRILGRWALPRAR